MEGSREQPACLTLGPQELFFSSVRLNQARMQLAAQCSNDQGAVAHCNHACMWSLSPAPTESWHVLPGCQTYCQTLTVSNHLQATVEAQLRAGSPERYSLSPSSITVKPGQSVTVDVRLRLLRFANKQKAVEQGQRDIFHIKASTAGVSL